MKLHGGISSLDLFFFIIVLKKEIKIASGCRISQFEKCSYEDFT